MVRLIDGESRHIDKSCLRVENVVLCLNEMLFNRFETCGHHGFDRNHSVRFAFENDKLIMTAQNVDAGDVREEISIEMEGEAVYTGFNVRYFQDILSATNSEQLVLELGDPLDPCIVRLPERDDCLFVVMPMRLD